MCLRGQWLTCSARFTSMSAACGCCPGPQCLWEQLVCRESGANCLCLLTSLSIWKTDLNCLYFNFLTARSAPQLPLAGPPCSSWPLGFPLGLVKLTICYLLLFLEMSICRYYCYCINGVQMDEQACPFGLAFNEALPGGGNCDNAIFVSCGRSNTSAPPTPPAADLVCCG